MTGDWQLPRHVRQAVHRTRHHVLNGRPIPLDLYAQLDAAGVDITELERNIRNGKA